MQFTLLARLLPAPRSLKVNAGVKHILTGLHPSAYVSYQVLARLPVPVPYHRGYRCPWCGAQIKADLKLVVADVQRAALGRADSDGDGEGEGGKAKAKGKGKNAGADDKEKKSPGKKGDKGKGKGKLSIEIALMTPFKPMLAEACKAYATATKKCPSGIIWADIKSV